MSNARLLAVEEVRIKLYPIDYDRVRDFYQTELGFPVRDEWNDGPDNRGVMFSVGQIVLELLSTGKHHAPQGVDLSLRVPNVDALWQAIAAHSTIRFPIRDNPWGDRSFCIAAPDGFDLTFFTLKT